MRATPLLVIIIVIAILGFLLIYGLTGLPEGHLNLLKRRFRQKQAAMGQS